jgi:hypothetical protein
MATLTLRTVKGSPLTNTEVDNNFTNLNTDKYESGDNMAPTDLDVGGDLTVTGSSSFSVGGSVSAAGTTQGDATSLTSTYNVVTAATANQGVVLPSAVTGLVVKIVNDTSVNINVYPATSDQIDANGSNVAKSLGPGMTMELIAVSGSKWNSMADVLVFDSSGTRIN